MSEEKTFNNNDIISIGDEIKYLRTFLKLTQADLAELLLVSRVTINALEKSKEPESITDLTAFRLYYLTQKIIEDPNKSNYAKNQASKIKLIVDKILQKRIHTTKYDNLTKK